MDRKPQPIELTATPSNSPHSGRLLSSMSGSTLTAIVLDTNVVLDWLLFSDPSTAPFAKAIATRRLAWVASPHMRDEFADVLGRGLAAGRGADTATLLATWDAHVTPAANPPPLPRSVPLRCTDPDDQIFLELAHAGAARWLLTRDRALLRLARQAAVAGFCITAPQGWPGPTME
jgi:predicted nucleic acid-binding protein